MTPAQTKRSILRFSSPQQLSNELEKFCLHLLSWLLYFDFAWQGIYYFIANYGRCRR